MALILKTTKTMIKVISIMMMMMMMMMVVVMMTIMMPFYTYTN